MRAKTILLSSAIATVFMVAALPAHAQTSCLVYPPGSTPPANYGTSWDVFDAGKRLLIKGDCNLSPEGWLPVTIGSGDTAQYVWKDMYSYKGPTEKWKVLPLHGEVTDGWIRGSGSIMIAINSGTSAAAPHYFVGYICTNRSSAWKCGCVDAACATRHWQLQAYKGAVTGETGGGNTTSGSGAPDTSTGWPANANPNLPLGGVFYGNPLSGEAIWPLEVGSRYDQYAQAFRAEKSGTIDRVQTDNRFPRPSEVGHYGKGRGGRMTVEIRTDDGTSAHKPSNTVIGRSGVFVPKDEAKGEVMDVALSQPATLVAGRIYHLVNTQLAFDEGSQSINANWLYASANVSMPGGPYFGKNLKVYYGNNNSWVLGGSSSYANDYLIPFVSVKYTDGTWVGTAGITHGRADTPFGGSSQVRQIFTVADTDRIVTGVWMRLFRKSGTTASLNAKIVSGSSVLAQSNIEASQFDSVSNQDSDPFDWVYWQFPNVITFQEGSTYSLVLSSSGQYEIHQIAGDYILAKDDRNHWMNASGQLSTNSGASWAPVERCFGSTASGIVGCEPDREGDFPILFTIQGMPRAIQ